MKRALTYLGCFSCSVLVVAIGFGWSPSVWADEPTKSSGPTDQDVQERAVPRMGDVPDAQFRQMQPPSRTSQGFVRQGNSIVAQPGYVLEQGPNNQVTVRIAGGSGAGQGAAGLQCSCVHSNIIVGSETCTRTVIGNSATCTKGSGATCQDTCMWTESTTGFSPERKLMQ